MSKPDDIPEWAWERAHDAITSCERGDDERPAIARAILKAKNDTIEECAEAAEQEFRSPSAIRVGFRPAWCDVQVYIAQAIRNLKHEV